MTHWLANDWFGGYLCGVLVTVLVRFVMDKAWRSK